MGRVKQYSNHRIPIIALVGVVIATVMTGNIHTADAADIAATVTVQPRVEALTASAIPLGTSSINPGQQTAVLLSLSIQNTYSESKTLSSITIRDASRGTGTPSQLLSNLDSLYLYQDSDGDSLLSMSDSLIASAAWDASNIALPTGPLSISSDSSVVLLLAVSAAMFPHDSDTADAYLRPASDIVTSDATPVIGADSLNSLGFGVIDGLVSAQLNTPATGLTSMGTGDTVYHVFTVDIPRNGYASDTLHSFTVHNGGTAVETDLEFVVLFSDDGDGLWGGFSQENLIAPLEYIGGHWAASDLAVPLVTPATRFFVGAKALPYPVNGASLILNIPEYGLLMASRNDGPLDAETVPVDTIEIQSEEGLLVTSVPLADGLLTPGEVSTPVFAFELRNGSRDDVSLDSLTLQLELVDPLGGASVPELEGQFDSLLLYLDGDGDATTIDPTDALIASTAVVNGPCRLAVGGIPINASGGEIGLSVVLATDLEQARNGNTVEIRIESETDLFFATAVTIFGNFPTDSGAVFTIDAFPARRVAVNNLVAMNLYGGQTDVPVLDFVAPGNGYAVDTLLELAIENIGNVEDDVALSTLKLWRDRLSDGFTTDDVLIATLTRGSLSWATTGFSQEVPAGGQRLILTADISNGQFDGGTVALSIPVGGMLYKSSMTGPDDESVEDESTHLIIPPQRITVVSVPSVSTTVRPGQTDNNVLTFALYNGYINEDKTLQSVRFENMSRSRSETDFADYEIGRLRLYFDANADRVLSGDPCIGTGYFQDGVLTVTGLDLSLPSESLAYFFVQTDVATDAIDSDSLGVRVNGISDFYFQEQVSINGDLPLTNGGWHIVDGSVKCQYTVLPLVSRSVNQGEIRVPLMRLKPSPNGDQVDTLAVVTVTNTGTADTSDVTDLRLWRDANGDDTWQITDTPVGDFIYAGSWWSAGGLNLAVGPPAPTLFVTGDIRSEATDERTISLSVPVNGCVYTSANDGPLDSALHSGSQFTITGSNLRIAYSTGSDSYSVGQTIVVNFTATNLSGVLMSNLTGICNLLCDPALALLDSAHLGPASVAAGDSTEFSAFYTAAEPGAVYWALQAVELNTQDSSSELITEPIFVEEVPSHVDIDFVSAMPATVTLGQKNIIPATFSFTHGDVSPSAAPVRLDTLKLYVEDGAGNALPANDVLSRIRMITDEMQTVEPAAIPASDKISFVFTPSIRVGPGEERSVSVVLDIDGSATATDFALSVPDESSVAFRDANSGSEVTVVSATGFPMATTSARIDRPPDRVLVSVDEPLDQNVNLDQNGAQLLRITLRHPGTVGTAPIQVTGLSLTMQDDSYVPQAFSGIFEAVQVINNGNVSGAAVGGVLNTDTLTLSLASPPILGPGESDILYLNVDIRPDAPLSRLRLCIPDSSGVSARNFSTGESVLVDLDMDVMPQGASFPLYSGWIQLRRPAQPPLVCMSPAVNAHVLAGAENVPLMDIVLTYPVTEEFSSVLLSNVSVLVLDTNDLALDPRILFERMGFSVDSSEAQYQTSVDPINGQTVFDFGEDGVLLGPSDTITVRLVADFESGVPYDHFLVRVGSLEAMRFTDATDSLQQPAAIVDPICETSVPFVVGPISILWPAGRPTITSNSAPLALVAAGQRNVLIFDATLEYDSPVPRGDLVFESFAGDLFKRTATDLETEFGSSVFESLRLRVNDVTWANDSSLSTANLSLLTTGEHLVDQGSSLRFQLEGDLSPSAPPGNYVYHFADSTFAVFSDKHVDTLLYPILTTGSYPLISTELSVGAADLQGSFTNYPNPFVASADERTTFGYFLSEEANVEIVLYTLTGDMVARVVDGERRVAGSHAGDYWDGLNNRGLNVAPGTYICVITAHYVSGGEDSAKRKVTVIR